ncbi:hypothetical protein QAD02_004060 [Eretmocerus hayati]|uniref:Uncharacterized protein n=1 Tax=Eretmocerus hayati TaxID=131215 RepID=A0ACC2NNM9_9HYME|nr:hypothetical protein QAD02_004060 [Eretmocerus hayati]
MGDGEEKELSQDDKKNYSVFMGKKYSGGPHGLGDPDDRFLRKVEKDVLIAKIVRDRSRQEKCIPEVEEFNKCCQSTSFAQMFKCRKETENLKECLVKWWHNKEFWDECTEQYLKDRAEYRRTGEPKKVRDFRNQVINGAID